MIDDDCYGFIDCLILGLANLGWLIIWAGVALVLVFLISALF